MNEKPLEDRQAETLDCDLCILGAGIAGLNALFAASRHLSAGDKVVVVDRNTSPAGMWTRVYSYVRLHQPHPMFTAGNIPWRGQSDPYYLATRTEVVEHLEHCYQVLTGKMHVDSKFGWEYLQHREGQDGSRPVTVECQQVDTGAKLNIRCARLIKAFGYDVQPKAPLELSSQAVLSVSPDQCDLLGPDIRKGAAPIYIIGGGKTGMDTAHMLMRNLPGRPIRMVVGAGTMFLNRDQANPSGLRKHYAGLTPLEILLDIASRFNGRNEHYILDYMRKNHCLALDASCRRFAFGLLSENENAEIVRGVDEVIKDHLVDVVDDAQGPTLLLRSGMRRRVEPGAVFINTTGYIDGGTGPYEPYLSAGGRVLSIQSRSAIHFLSSQSSYFLTHLFMLDKLAAVPLYEVDVAELRGANREVFPATAITLTLYNSAVIIKHLPRWALEENGLDFMLMFPMHRRLLAFGKLMLHLKLHPTLFADAMDTVRERFNIRLGPLSHAPPSHAAVRAAS